MQVNEYTPCIKCGKIKDVMLTIKDPEELFGEMICKGCHIEHEKKIKELYK